MPNLQNVAKGLQSTLGSMTYAASLLQIVGKMKVRRFGTLDMW